MLLVPRQAAALRDDRQRALLRRPVHARPGLRGLPSPVGSRWPAHRCRRRGRRPGSAAFPAGQGPGVRRPRHPGGAAAPPRHRGAHRGGVRRPAGADRAMTGPVQVLVVGFEQPSFSGEVMAELDRLGQAGTIRLLDVLLVARAADGSYRLAPVPRGAPQGGRVGGRDPRRGRGRRPTSTTSTAPTPRRLTAPPGRWPTRSRSRRHRRGRPHRAPVGGPAARGDAAGSGGRALDETWLAPAGRRAAGTAARPGRRLNGHRDGARHAARRGDRRGPRAVRRGPSSSGIRLPQVVVLILGGVMIGPEVLGWADPESMSLFANVGLGFLFLPGRLRA